MPSVLSADGTPITYDLAGEGPPLILVDGALMTRRAGRKADLVDLLAPHFTVVSYDRRGRGDSGDNSYNGDNGHTGYYGTFSPGPATCEVDDIAALVASLGGRVFTYGHSSGACLALEAALGLGGALPKVAVYDAPWDDDPASQKAWSAYLQQLASALGEGRRKDAVDLFFAYIGTPKDELEARHSAPFWPRLEAVAHTLAYDHAAVMGPTVAVPRERLSMLTAPTLVMYGALSLPFMRATAITLSEVIPAARLRRLEGQPHDVAPAVLAPALCEFFLP